MSELTEAKARTAEIWGSAPFELAAHMLAQIHLELVSRLEPQPGERWLDLATGSGAVAVLAARSGAQVTGIDLAAPLVESARRNAADKGLDATFEVADVEALPFDDASFDVLSSSMGIIFAPDHAAVARELARVCAPGGRLGFTAWEPGGGFGVVLDRYAPPPDPEAGDPNEWAGEDHVRELLGEAFELQLEHRQFHYAPEPGEVVWERVTAAVGPFKALASSLEGAAAESFHRDFVEHVDSFGDRGVEANYLLVLGVRR